MVVVLSPSTCPNSLTSEGSTRVGIAETGEAATVFFCSFSFLVQQVGVVNCCACSGVKALQ